MESSNAAVRCLKIGDRVECFDNSVLSVMMRELEISMRRFSTDEKRPEYGVSVQYLDFLSVCAQLPGWRHFSIFVYHRRDYVASMLSAESTPSVRATASSLSGETAARASATPFENMIIAPDSVEALLERGLHLLRRACARVDYCLKQQRASATVAVMPLDMTRTISPMRCAMATDVSASPLLHHTAGGSSIAIDECVKVLSADTVWRSDVTYFRKQAELRVSRLVSEHAPVFTEFRALQIHGVQWPHSTSLRHAIERAGFVYRPMMIKRDRCVCTSCGVEASGWRSWHDPMLLHRVSCRYNQLQRAGRAVASAVPTPAYPMVV